MKLAADVESFLDDPVGRYVSGHGWVHFCAGPALWGAILWGRAERENLTRLFEVVEQTLQRAGEHVSLLDIRGLEHVDLAGFSLVGRYVKKHRGTLAQRVIRHAVIRSETLVGAVAAGSYEIFAPPYPVSLFTDFPEAIAWLDPPMEPNALGGVSLLCDNAAGVPPLVARLRATVATDLVEADLSRAASRMGMSARTLQRRLKEAGTTFRAELDVTRVHAAQHRMLHTTEPLTHIAVDLGFSTLQNFSRQFRRVAGETPSGWRERVRPEN